MAAVPDHGRPVSVWVLLLAAIVAAASIWLLETRRSGIAIDDLRAETTPVTRYQQVGTDGPVIVVAHGFAGSRQMMQAYSLTLAQAGYRVYAFDFEGHGRNPVPMSGDLSAIEGTTGLLIEQTLQVIDFAATDAGWTEPIGLLGHSMATDVLIRTALQTEAREPVVAISAFSQAVNGNEPDLLLLIPGQWEPHLRTFAEDAIRQVLPNGKMGETVNGFVTRRAVVAPYVEHVAILYSRTAQREALNWMNRAFGWTGVASVPPTGWAFAALMAAIVATGVQMMRLLPVTRTDAQPVTGRAFWLAALALPLLLPVIAVQLRTGVLPVLVADYLALHLLLIGAAQLAVLRWAGVRFGAVSVTGLAALTVFSLGVFGVALDRYAANFWPIAERLWVIALLLPGAVLFMLADRVLCQGAALWRRVVLRLGFLASLIVAVALDPERLFFLAMIAPVIVLFYAAFGQMGRAAALRTGPVGPGIALGLVLAWSLGVSFPMFAAGG